MENTLKIAVAQINCTVGDLDGNARRIAEAVAAAREAGADIVGFDDLGHLRIESAEGPRTVTSGEVFG